MMNIGKNMLKRFAVLLVISVITACGGADDESGAPPFGSEDPASTAPTAASLVLQLDTATIDNSGAASVKATATATTAAGQAVTGVPVSFSVDNNAVFSVDSSAT